MTRAAQRLPNFFLAGVSKAGTTSLHRYLDQHPQVFMSPVKEPMFFAAADLLSRPYWSDVAETAARHAKLEAYLDGPQPPGAEHFVLEWEDYVRLFRDVREETAVGESSTAYLWLPSAAGAIRSAVPDARLVFVLRDPADRLFTLYRGSLRREPGVPFRDWFQASLEQPRRRFLRLDPARYATHLQRFFDAFPRERARVYLYDDYRTDARAVLRDLFAFLGVRPDYPVDVSRRHNETLQPRFPRLHAMRRRMLGDASLTRWLPDGARRALSRLYLGRGDGRPMDPADRRLAIDHYRDEIVRTQELVGRDLSAWLR
jgi:hypothetical protein